ncbi:MAG: long-chain fatty acid--CoA ligase [Phycisphaerales bacterium]|nr:MAG: long-chain fatty acid--CoA ligase [Phycisphaerales bacterium]
MRVFSPIYRRLILSPLSTWVVDDQKTWKGYELLVGALHLAGQIRRTTDQRHVGVMLPTSGLFPMALIATWLLGRTIVPINYLLKKEDREYVINDAEIDTVITVTPMIDMFGELPDGINEIRLDKMKFKGIPPIMFPKKTPDDFVAVLLYTSGTSGKPKGVMLTSENLRANVEQCVEWANFTKKDVLLGVLPQFHSFGLTVLTLLPLITGCKAVYTARFVPKKILELMKQHRPTAFIGIPSMYNALLSAKSAKADDLKSLKYIVSGGEPLPQAVFDGFKEKFGITINEGYGLTETGPVANWCRPHDHKPRSVGQPLPRVEEKIVDAEGNEVGTGEDGEVCIKGPNVMKGYYKLQEETDKVLDKDGFFHTGDMGRFDEDGHLYITGRYKEMLIIGGENVFPREIEEVLNAHPSVHSSAVIGMQDSSRGEVALAFVELEEDAEFDAGKLRSHCRDRLAGYKVPRDIRVVKELPRNPTGKIMRRELSEDTPSEAEKEAAGSSSSS